MRYSTMLTTPQNSHDNTNYYTDSDQFKYKTKKYVVLDNSNIHIYKPSTPLNSFVGLEEIKKGLLKDLTPLASATGSNEKLDRILLFGETGTGKRHLVQAIATQLNATLIECKGAYLESICEWENNMEFYTKAIYDTCQEMESHLCILYINNPQCLFKHSKTKGVLYQFIRNVQSEWNVSNRKSGDGSQSRLAIVAGSSKPFDIEKELIHLFHRRIYIPTLNVGERQQLLERAIYERWELGHSMSASQLEQLSRRMDGILTVEIDIFVQYAISLQFPQYSGNCSSLDAWWEFKRNTFLRPVALEDFLNVTRRFSTLKSQSFIMFEQFQRMHGNGPFMKMGERDDDSQTTRMHEEETKQPRMIWKVIFGLLCYMPYLKYY